jgi:hypothetical protein
MIFFISTLAKTPLLLPRKLTPNCFVTFNIFLSKHGEIVFPPFATATLVRCGLTPKIRFWMVMVVIVQFILFWKYLYRS